VIYFVRRTDSVEGIKIGTTIRLSQRIKQLEKKEGVSLKVLGIMDGSYADEAALHRRFIRIDGEWFHPTPELLDFIATEARPWDGKDEIPLSELGASVKLPIDVIEMARIVAACRNETMTELLGDTLRPLLEKMQREEFAKRSKPPKSKGESR
jgi:hypothetical protein